MVNKDLMKIFGDLGNLTKIDEHCWADEEGKLVSLESTCFDDRGFNWMAAPGAYYISILEIFDYTDPIIKLELCLIKQEERSASKIWFVKHSDRPWEYQTIDIVDIAGFGSNYKKIFSRYSEKRLILTEITKEMFEGFRDQLKNTGKFEFKFKTEI